MLGKEAGYGLLIESDPMHFGDMGDKKTKVEAEYRKGAGPKNCGNCAHFRSSACTVVEGQIHETARCRFFIQGEDKVASINYREGCAGDSCDMCSHRDPSSGFCKTAGAKTDSNYKCDYMTFDNIRADRLLKAAAEGERKQSSTMASLLGQQIEEKTQLREQMAAQQASEQTAAQMGGQAPAQAAPAAAPQGQAVTPQDPNAAMQDPNAPQDPAMQEQMMQEQMMMEQGPSPEESILSQELQASKDQLEKNENEIRELKDENRALHLAVQPEVMEGPSERLYNRAGGQTPGVQKIPNENLSQQTELDPESMENVMKQMIGQ